MPCTYVRPAGQALTSGVSSSAAPSMRVGQVKRRLPRSSSTKRALAVARRTTPPAVRLAVRLRSRGVDRGASIPGPTSARLARRPLKACIRSGRQHPRTDGYRPAYLPTLTIEGQPRGSRPLGGGTLGPMPTLCRVVSKPDPGPWPRRRS